MRKLNLIGQKFNKLLVISEAEPVGKRKRSAWLCQCDCGILKVIMGDNLKRGETKSCGCWNDEQRSARAEQMYSANIKYHPSETTARRIWRTSYNDGIPFEDFFELSQQNCHYCGSNPNNIQNAAKDDKKSSQYARTNGNFTYNGLDRIDNSLPHSKENCVPCCKWCNYAKRERSTEEFKSWVKQLYDNLFLTKLN